MAKGVDELVHHVLSEVALTGVQGMHDSCLLSYYSSLLFPISNGSDAYLQKPSSAYIPGSMCG